MSNVKDVKSKAIKLTLNDGVEHTLKFDLNAMAELEDKYGSVDAAFEKLDQNSFKAIRTLLWAGLLHVDENLSEQKVGSLIDMDCLREITKSLGDAFSADMPVDERAEQGNA